MVRYRSRVDVERGFKEGATLAAHIGGLPGAGTWLSPAEVEALLLSAHCAKARSTLKSTS